jgi:methylphosphotriester-DNA--protein-cysteine methyltransferase
VAVHLSPDRLRHLFKQQVGCTVSHYARTPRCGRHSRSGHTAGRSAPSPTTSASTTMRTRITRSRRCLALHPRCFRGGAGSG